MKKILAFLFLSGILVLPGCLFEKPSSVLPEEIPSEDIFSPEEESLPQTQENPSNEANIIIESPKPGELISSPFEIRGRARVFEGAVNVDVKKEDGSLAFSEVLLVRSKSVGEFGDFSVNLAFDFKNTRKGTIEIYSLSPKDGSKENLVVIPVEFKIVDTQ